MFLVQACVNWGVLCAFTLPFDPITNSTEAFIECKLILQNNCPSFIHTLAFISLSQLFSDMKNPSAKMNSLKEKTDNG